MFYDKKQGATPKYRSRSSVYAWQMRLWLHFFIQVPCVLAWLVEFHDDVVFEDANLRKKM
jgi:hypothetical protein